jgi:hypothetical protein
MGAMREALQLGIGEEQGRAIFQIAHGGQRPPEFAEL